MEMHTALTPAPLTVAERDAAWKVIDAMRYPSPVKVHAHRAMGIEAFPQDASADEVAAAINFIRCIIDIAQESFVVQEVL